MAPTIHLNLEAGDSEIQGDSSVEGGGRRNSIEVLQFRYGLRPTEYPERKPAPQGGPHPPVWLRLKVGPFFPGLMQAQLRNEVCEGAVRFVSPAGRAWQTLRFKGGRISRLRLVAPPGEGKVREFCDLEIVAERWESD